MRGLQLLSKCFICLHLREKAESRPGKRNVIFSILSSAQSSAWTRKDSGRLGKCFVIRKKVRSLGTRPMATK